MLVSLKNPVNKYFTYVLVFMAWNCFYVAKCVEKCYSLMFSHENGVLLCVRYKGKAQRKEDLTVCITETCHYMAITHKLLRLTQYAHRAITQDASHKITVNAIVAIKKLRHKVNFMLRPTERVTIGSDFHRINGAIYLTYESIWQDVLVYCYWREELFMLPMYNTLY
jgi:hypothetical protein